MNPSMRPKITIAGLLFSAAGIIITVLLVCKHSFPDLCESSFGCSIDGVDGCDQLGKSPYSSVFGISVASLGLIFYSALFVLWALLWKNKDDSRQYSITLAAIFFLSAFGLVTDIVLAYINFTVLLVPCLLCIYTYIATLLIFLSAVLAQKSGEIVKDITLKDTLKPAVFSATGGLIIALLIHGCMVFISPGQGDQNEGLLPPDQTERLLEEFNTLKQVDMNVAGLNAAGDENAYIEIHEFADFLCPHCRHAAKTITMAKKKWPGRIKVYYRHFPLDGSCNPVVGRTSQPVGDWRCNAAQAAICAESDPNFTAFYNGIFAFQETNPPMIGLTQLEALAKRTGADWNQIVSCMGTARMKARLDRDIRDASALNIRSTPTLVVNGRLLSAGAPDPAFFMALMDSLVYEKEGQKAYDEFKERKP